MQICRIRKEKLREALDLVWEVFEKYEVPLYEEMGVKTFLHFIEYHNMVEKINQGEMTFWGSYLNQYLVGVIAVRGKQHISLLFVRDKFHHLGIATALMQVAIDHIRSQELKIPAITVHSSPYAVGFYKKTGFVPLSEEQKADGIRFTPMRRDL